MNDMNPRAIIGGNNPQDPIDAATAPYAAAIAEAENWLGVSPSTIGNIVANEIWKEEV